MSTASGLVVPIAMWGRRAPTHCVTVLYLLRDQKTLVTGSADGQVLCISFTFLTSIFYSYYVVSGYFVHFFSECPFCRFNPDWL